MAETVIFAEQTLTGFTDGQLIISPAPFVLTVGETYRVVWDGVEHECVCVDAGGPVITDADNMEEPTSLTFLIAAVVDESEGIDIASMQAYDLSGGSIAADTATEHIVAIYHVVEDSGDSGETEDPETPTSEGIILKDRNGNDVAYYGIETVTFDTTTEGKQQIYTKGTAVDNVEIVPNFSTGDMTVTADEADMMKSATVIKPDALQPENIRHGTVIAGIEGTLIGDTEEITVGTSDDDYELTFADNDELVIEPSAETKVISKVTINKPETLLPENIVKDVEIAGVVGTFAGDLDEILRYFQCHIDPTTNTITLYKIFYDLIYADTGSYDVTIPDTINDMAVVIAVA